jgi:glycosyltransferase involved in cell wall biosynthesis
MRILITPQPRSCDGPGIFLSRTAKEIERRGYRWTARPFHYLSISVPRWDYAFVMGCPRHIEKVFQSGRPYVVTMGKPESPQEQKAIGGRYTTAHQRQKELLADTISRSERTVFISNYVRHIWKEYFSLQGLCFPEENNIRVIYHGLDTNDFCPAKTPPKDSSKTPFVIGMAGSIRDVYRLRTLFAASSLLKFEHRLLIIGSMSKGCKKFFAKKMRDKNLALKTTYQPWVNPANLVGWYRQMRCLFHPVDYEGCGIVVAEALACGVPVVVPAHGAPKEYILGGAGVSVNTVQYRYDDEFCRLMADGITKVRENYASYSAEARQRAVENLSIEKMMNSYLDFMGLPKYIR